MIISICVGVEREAEIRWLGRPEEANRVLDREGNGEWKLMAVVGL